MYKQNINFDNFIFNVNNIHLNEEQIIKFSTINIFVENMYYDDIYNLFLECSNSVVMSHINLIKIENLENIEQSREIMKNIIESNLLKNIFDINHLNIFLTYNIISFDELDDNIKYFYDLNNFVDFIVIYLEQFSN